MLGQMMDTPLLIKNLASHAERNHGFQEIVSIAVDNERHRYTFSDALSRSRKVTNLLDRLSCSSDARIATLAWNDYRHVELYYGVSCSGRVLHTVNPRLFPEQLIYILNHAEDELVFFDVAFTSLLESIAGDCPSVKGYVALVPRSLMPDSSLPNLMCYEDLLAEESSEHDWPDFDENTASGLCYTSGTTGNPKGVLYSHRSTVLHTYGMCMPDAASLSARDVILPVVPMFHVNAWGYPYAGMMVGAKIVLPGPKLGDAETLVNLINDEGATIAGGVPTVWLPLLEYLKKTGKKIETLTRTVIGGSACPLSMMEDFRDNYGVTVLHGWGMTEMSPVGVVNTPNARTGQLTGEALKANIVKQGRALPGVEIKITDDDNQSLPWDGIKFGALKVRGPWVCSGYYRVVDSDAHQPDGWFDTGDVATIDADGCVKITDRTKDVIKSGGEWISSIDLENVGMSYPGVRECAVVGMAHTKWQERPLLVVVAKDPSEDFVVVDFLLFFEGKVAKWWIPNDVIFVTELPHTATGKISKLLLRQSLEGYRFPDDQ
jgi:3-(methylthio)propionyl---CoA ligase